MARTISLETLKKVATYNPVTGEFFRLPREAGDAPLDGADSSGYRRISIKGRAYKLHLLAWLWMTGEWPTTLVDHENRIKSDNRWDNLRPADWAQNTQNAKVRSDNRSGVKGVSWHLRTARWHARIQYRCKRVFLGEFHSLAEAEEVIDLARQLCHGEFACGGAN